MGRDLEERLPRRSTSEWRTYPGEMTDVFTRLVGQDRAVAAMRQYARNPVHAYLFTGPAGASVRDSLIAFAAALQCPRNGCGECDICRLVLAEQDADVYFAERSGVSWRMEEIREAERVARRRPLGEGYQIVVIEDVELTTTGASPSAPALLKSLEEPPARTIFLLSAEELSTGPRHDRLALRRSAPSRAERERPRSGARGRRIHRSRPQRRLRRRTGTFVERACSCATTSSRAASSGGAACPSDYGYAGELVAPRKGDRGVPG